jgi:hypothetical protein
MKIADAYLSPNNGRAIWFAILVALLFSAAARIPQMGIPFDRDEGSYAYASNVIDRGGLPFRDAFDDKPPAIYYIYNLSFRLFGHNIRAPRIMALLFVAAACVFTFLFVFRIGSSYWAGILSAGLLAWASSSPAYAGFGANTEIFMLPFIAAATLCLIGDGYSKRRYFLCGLLYGFAVIVKQIALPIALFSFVCIGIYQFRNIKRLISMASAFFVGLLLPFALFTIWFSVKGAFESYWAGFYVYNRSYATTLALRKIWRNFFASMKFILSLDPGTWLAACLGLMALWLFPIKMHPRLLLIASLAGSFAGIAIGGYFFPHYFLILLPFFAMAAGVGGAALGGRGTANFGKWLVTILLIGSISIGVRFSLKSNDEKLGVVYGDDLFSRTLTVGRFLGSCADKDSTVFILGSEPQILFYSGLQASSRFYLSYPLMQPSPLRRAFRDELISSTKINPPDYLIRVNYPGSLSTVDFAHDDFNQRIETLFSSYRAIGISIKGSSQISTDVPNPEMERLYGSIVIYKRIQSNQSDASIKLHHL